MLRTTASLQLVTVCLLVAFTVSCSIYRPEIDHGQFVESKDIDKLYIGMPAAEVIGIMGTPLVVDSFNRSRWDYVHIKIDDKRTVVERQKISIVFSDGLIEEIIVDKQEDEENGIATEAIADEESESAEKDKEPWWRRIFN